MNSKDGQNGRNDKIFPIQRYNICKMAKTIIETLIDTLQDLIDNRLNQNGLLINETIDIPKDNLASWHAAMEFLRRNGIVEYRVVDINEKLYDLSLSPIDEQYDLRCIFTKVDIDRLNEICREYRISRTKPARLAIQRWLENTNKSGTTIIDVGSRLPDKVYDVDLHFEKGSLILNSDFCRLKIPQTGRPADVLNIVAVKGCLNISFGKNAIETKLSKRISDSLPTIFKDNILRHELSNFADIKPKEITVYSKGQLRESELRQIQNKIENYYG